MKIPSLILASALMVQLSADTVYTIPQGYTKITFPAASGGTPSLTAMSATLLNDVEFAGTATVNSDFSSATTPNSQTVSVAGASWSANQFTTDPHLAYLMNASGAEEAFLITSHTANTLTIDGSYNLLAGARFTTASSVKIRKANTVGSLLGTTATPFTTTDRAFIWTGTGWQALVAASGNWFYIGGPGGIATDAVIFPEEGIFIQRAAATDAVLTLFGEVPSAPQTATVTGASASFVSTRFPVGNFPAASPTGTKLEDLNIESIPGWDTTDRAFYWTGSAWQSLVFAGGNWFYIGGPGGNANALVIEPNSALFLSRSSAGAPSASPLTIQLPYTVTLFE